jgi:hypothetical protein
LIDKNQPKAENLLKKSPLEIKEELLKEQSFVESFLNRKNLSNRYSETIPDEAAPSTKSPETALPKPDEISNQAASVSGLSKPTPFAPAVVQPALNEPESSSFNWLMTLFMISALAVAAVGAWRFLKR